MVAKKVDGKASLSVKKTDHSTVALRDKLLDQQKEA